MTDESSAGNQWVIVDIDGADVSMALVVPSSKPRLSQIRRYRSDDFPTATGCFQQYAQDVGINLFGRKCAVAVSGAVTGDTLRLSRCKWIISVSGLGHLFGSPPVMLNDSVAKAWACFDLKPHECRSLSSRELPTFDRIGRWISINAALGIGAASLTTDKRNQLTLSDSEFGHIGFSPDGEKETILVAILNRGRYRVSWEQVLALETNDPVWSDAKLAIAPRDVAAFRAGLFGAFCGDVALGLAGWAGMFIHGERMRFIAQPECSAAFNKRFEAKGTYTTTICAIPRWFVTPENVCLNGAAHCLASIEMTEKEIV
jgi:glucokinase